MRRHFGIRFVICQFLFSGCLGAAVTLGVSPSSISLSGLASSNTPITSYSARVTATGTGSGALTVSTTPAFSWLSAWASSPTIAAGRGAVVIAVSADPGNGDLNTGTNSGSVTITSGTSSVTIKVTFSISSPPATISADQTCLAFSATLGGSSPATQALHVDSSNGLSVGLTATASTSSGGSWLKVSPGSTSTSATLTVTATVGALSANTYNGAIQIKPANGTSTLNVPVTMTVAATGSRGSLRIDGGCSTTLVFNESAGSTSPDARSAQLTATGTGVINFTVSPPSASWITSVSTTASDGTKVTKVTGGGPAVTVTVTVTPAGKQLVSDSPLTATVTISGDSGPPVTIIVVLTSQGTDIFASLPAPFSPLLAGQQSDANNIVVTTTNNNGTSVSVTPSTQDGAKWLVANSSSSKSNVNVPGTISVVVDAGSLRPGTYNGSVKLECQGAPCVPVLVTLTVTVTPPPNLMSDQSSLTFAAVLGGSPPTAKALQISASDGSALNFTLSPTTTGGTNWLAASSSRISTPAAVNVTATLGSLPVGTYNGTVNIQVSPSNNTQPLSIPVTFTVTRKLPSRHRPPR